MAKKKISSIEEYLKVAVETAYGGSFSLSREEWDNMVQDRYDRGTNIYTYRIRDFANKKLLGKTANAAETFNLMRRLDDIIETQTNPVNKTMAMAARRVIYPQLEEIAESQLIASVDSFYGEIVNDYNVSDSVKKAYREKKIKSDRIINGAKINNRPVDPNSCKLNELPVDEKSFVLMTIMKSFMDKTVTKDDSGELFGTNPAMQELMELIQAEADSISKSAAGIKGASVKPMDDTEKKDLEELKSVCKKMSKEEKQTFENGVREFNTLQKYADMDITPRLDHADLVLEKNPIVDITAEKFVEKQSKGELSPAETEWGESNIDYMLRRLYTDDELKTLRRAGIDPAAGIYVDGKPFDWYKSVSSAAKENPSELHQDALKKCEIVAKAISGAKIDISKIVPDGNGSFKSEAPIPVKTDFSMKTEKRSFFKWLKNFVGIEPTISKKIRTANNETRNYQDYIAPTDIVSPMEKTEVFAQARERATEEAALTSRLDAEFFGKAFPEIEEYDQVKIDTAVFKALNYNNFKFSESANLGTCVRVGSRVNLAVLYGMTKGYSLEEMLHGENVDREAIGKEFLEEFRVMKYDEFAKANNLRINDETKDKYKTYLCRRRENVEMFCAKGMEKLRELEIPRLDPNNHLEFAKNYNKFSRISSIACDFSQSVGVLRVDNIAPFERDRNHLYRRAASLGKLVHDQTQAIQLIGGAASIYADYLKSDYYIKLPDNLKKMNVDIGSAAKSKVCLNLFNEITKDKRTLGDIIDDSEISAEIAAASFIAESPTNGEFTDNDIRGKINSYLQLKKGDPSPISINRAEKSFVYDGISNHFGEIYENALNDIMESQKAYDKKISVEGKETMSMSEALLKQIEEDRTMENRKRNAHISEEISFDELLDLKETEVTKPPHENAVEKTMDMGGIN